MKPTILQALSLDSIFSVLSIRDRISIHKYITGKINYSRLTTRAMRFLAMICEQDISPPQLKYRQGAFLHFYHPETNAWYIVEELERFYPRTCQIMNNIKKQILHRELIHNS